MILIDREMQVTKTVTNKGQTSLDCQASLNSNGVITLRNYTVGREDSDEIIVLSHEETEAIFELFRKLKKAFKCVDGLPF